ncbi:uncharacterized protein [Dysidea avara]|uniref:uncharacterized protein isoform X1 n=1 Tax=Dysidea avara TaxID=196820 RepID=UPI00332CEE26
MTALMIVICLLFYNTACYACPGVGQIYSVDCYPTDASCDNPDPHAVCDGGRCVCPRGKVLDHSTNPPRCVYTSDCPNICYQPLHTGDCEIASPIARYFYNSTSQSCEQFLYRRCGGNLNRFGSEEECQDTCGPGATIQPIPTDIDTCRLQPESGPCLAYFPSYFYNSSSQVCEMFLYGGCGGNKNRFRTIEDCQVTCGQSVNVCKLDPEAGPCETYVPAYFYNATSQMCERFTYGGCHGNGNKFFTITECQRACGKTNKMCGLQAEPGNCQGSFPSYFYNTATEECEMFIYSGCGGNQNKFSDIDSCRRTCSASTTPAPIIPKRNVVIITVSFTGDDLEAMEADFAAELTNVLANNGIIEVAIQVVDISYNDNNDVVLYVAVYSSEVIVDGTTVAALINENKDDFDISISHAVVETGDDSGGLSAEAIAGILVGSLIGLAVVILVIVMVLCYNKQSGSTTKYSPTTKAEVSEGIKNPLFSQHKE